MRKEWKVKSVECNKLFLMKYMTYLQVKYIFKQLFENKPGSEHQPLTDDMFCGKNFCGKIKGHKIGICSCSVVSMFSFECLCHGLLYTGG